MSIHVSEPGRPVGTRMPEVHGRRRVGDVSQLVGSAPVNPEYSEATDAELQSALHSERTRALEEYGAAAGERKAQRPYLPISSIYSPTLQVVQATATIADAITLMKEHDTNHLVVMAEDNVAGLLSQQWLLGWLYEHTANPYTSILTHIELPAFLTATPETDAHQLARLMLAHQLNAALVMDAQAFPAGVVTSTDYLRLYARSEQQGRV